MKRSKFHLPILALVLGILITSCSNYNNLQFHKSQRLAKTSFKSEKKQSFPALKEEGFTESQTETDPELTVSANDFSSQNNDIAQIIQPEKKDKYSAYLSEKKANLTKLINTTHAVEKHLKTSFKKNIIRNDVTEKSPERKTFDTIHWILVGLMSVLFCLIVSVLVMWKFFAITPIGILLLIILILSIIQSSYLSKKVPISDRNSTYDRRAFFARFSFGFSLILLILRVVVLILFLILILSLL